MKGVNLKSNNGGRRPFKQRDEFSAIVVNHRIKDKSIRLIDDEGRFFKIQIRTQEAKEVTT